MASLETRPKSFRVVWYEDGQKQAVTFHDPEEAARFKLLVEGHDNHWPAGWTKPQAAAAPTPPEQLTFDGWARRAIAHRSRATERTRADYLRDLDRHFADIGPLPLTEITDDDVTAWLDDRHDADLAPKTIRNLVGFASSLYVQAMRRHPPVATWNPFAGRLPDHAAIKDEEMVFFTPQEFGSFEPLILPEYRKLFRALFGTGLRFGEATALWVRDIELLGKRKTLTVRKAWKRAGSADWVLGEPKTKRSRRTIGLSDDLVDLFAEVTAGKRGDDLVFSRESGARLPHTEVWKRGWAPAIARANVCDSCYATQKDGRGNRPTYPAPCDCLGVLGKVPRIHDCRHSHVAALIAEGIRLETISRRLGHSSITITFDRYGHLDPRLDDEINAATDRSLASVRH